MAVVYRIENLTKIYKGSTYKANNDLTVDIHEGEIFGLLGPNGAGKSTLLNQIVGFIRPTSGSIRLFGMDVVKMPQVISSYVAIQPQQSTALSNLYPEEAIFQTALFRSLTAKMARKQTNELMEILQLDHVRKKCIRSISGGQQKLVTLAVALIGNLPVQVFDEPTNELDPMMRKIVWEKLLKQNSQGTTIILVTHNVLEAERVIQRVGIINSGRLMALGTPSELKTRVDQRIRLEILFKKDIDRHISLLKSLGETHELTRQHWIVLCPRDRIHEGVNEVLMHIGLDQIEDFRILTPSLEDVYLQLGGTKLG